MTNIIKIGLVGTGRIGRVHARTLQQLIPHATIHAVTDVNAQSANEVAAMYNIPHVTADFEQILADSSIDAVVICSSTDTHAPFIKLAAQAGKHIFCEKPIAADLGVSVSQLAIAWAAKNPRVSTVITGASKLSQLQSNLEALEVIDKLTPEVLARIDEVTAALAE